MAHIQTPTQYYYHCEATEDNVQSVKIKDKCISEVNLLYIYKMLGVLTPV